MDTETDTQTDTHMQTQTDRQTDMIENITYLHTRVVNISRNKMLSALRLDLGFNPMISLLS